MASLAEIRARLAQSETKNSNQSQGDNAIYPHWNIAEGTAATLRFIPDGNSKNTFFWQERAMIRLPFAGIKGEVESKQVQVRVPCVEMWGDTCPILSEVRNWFKDKSMEEMGRKYWKKRDYIFQGFVRENPLADDKTPDNPIRRFIIGPQIFTSIKSALMDPELEELPTDYLRGLDFRITKGSKGGFADLVHLNGLVKNQHSLRLNKQQLSSMDCLIYQHSYQSVQQISNLKLLQKCLKLQLMDKAMMQNVGGSTSAQQACKHPQHNLRHQQQRQQMMKNLCLQSQLLPLLQVVLMMTMTSRQHQRQ